MVSERPERYQSFICISTSFIWQLKPRNLAIKRHLHVHYTDTYLHIYAKRFRSVTV